MPKPFMTYDQQIEKLKSKHLTIADEASAKATLRQIGYYALITGYKDLFKNPTTRNYRDGTTFDDIVALYHFDEHLRELTLHHLLQIERHIRSSLSYAFCSFFGDAQSAYLDPQNFDCSSARRKEKVQQLIERYLSRPLTHPTDHSYLEHHKTAHGNVPLWVLVNVLTFGTLSKFYELSAPQVQTAVSQEFEGIDEHQLAQLLDVLSKFRNLCAHGERLFSHRCATKDIPDLPLHQALHLPQRGTTYTQGKRDYLALVIAFRSLLPASEFQLFEQKLCCLIQDVVSQNSQLSESDLLSLMGFPANWQEISSSPCP